jgi:hypothetical protein
MLIGALISVVAVALGIQTAVSKQALASPTITSKPANPTSSTSASFTFTGPNGAAFKCRLDGSAFAACTSPKSYSALSQGSHTFQVKSALGADKSTPTAYTWVVDPVAPSAPSITAKPASLSNTTSPSFSFTDSESGVSFRCSIDSSAYTVCSSPRTYSGLAQGTHTFGVQAVDAAGNVSPATTYSWSIDSVPPAAPVITTKPTDPTSNATNTFAWTGGETGLTYQCSVENGAWATCTSPYTWTIDTSNSGQHQFAVRAVDAAGNISAGTYYQFKYQQARTTTGMPFQISGSVGALSLGVWKPIPLTISNPNSVTIYVNALNVGISADSTPSGCPSSTNVELQQSNVSTTLTLAVPPNGSVTLPTQTVVAPQIRLKDLPTVNQDVCKGKSFTLSYSGTATN